jgi:nucleotide-binding universal stress UspA family protein
MKVLLPVDGSAASDAALDALIHQFNPRDTEVRVLHIVEQTAVVSTSLAFADSAAAAGIIAEQFEELRRHGHQIADRSVHRLQAAGFGATADVRDGEARFEVLSVATRWPADAIMMGSHGRSGFDRLMMGSVAEHVLRHAPCSVEIVRPALAVASGA